MKWLEDFCWFVSDRFYPRLRPLSKEASDREKELASDERSRCEEQIKSLPDDEDVVAKYLAECDVLLENEESKRLNVEARLTNLVGLSSITGTIVFGVILGLATGTLRVTGTILKCVIAVGALYLVLQICWAILASIRGLGRRGYVALNTSFVLPLQNEARSIYLRRQITMRGEKLADDRLQNSEKVNQMALAHCATKNFLWALVLFALIGTWFAATLKNPSDDLIQRIRQDHELYEMLRGPQGPKGDPGPPGPEGKAILGQSPPAAKKQQ